jgi:hypothetical protein
MGLVVSAQVIRELIADGEYLVECIEQREHGRVAATFTLRSRAQPYDIQIETSDSKLEGLFRALLPEKGARTQKSPLAQAQVGGQRIPVVEVPVLPADTPRRGRRRAPEAEPTEKTDAAEGSVPVKRRRGSSRQLVLMPQDAPIKARQGVGRVKRGRPPRVGETPEPS